MKHDYVGNNTTQGQRKAKRNDWIFYLVFIVAWMLFVALFAVRAAG